MERYRRILVLLLAVAVAIPVFTRSRPGRETPAPAAFSVMSAGSGSVQVSGDVRHPGVYPVSAKILTSDVISMAEPVRPFRALHPPAAGSVVPASGDAINLSISADGSAVVTRGVIPVAQRLVLGIPLDLDTISESELDAIPGIGPGLAHRIVQYRQNNGGRMAVGELLSVEGVGERKFAALQKHFQPAGIR